MSKRHAPSHKASRRHHTTRTCNGKVRYRDHAEASRALQAINGPYSERDLQKKPVRAYPCDTCNGWHLTSSKTWDGR